MQETCIIIPCFNEENRLPITEFNEFYEKSDSVFFCFVNDGSKDQTLKLLNNIALNRQDRIRIINLDKNQGKAEAIRQGMMQCMQWKKFAYIGYFDADFSTPLQQINLLLNFLKENPYCDLAFGSRVKLLGRKIERNSFRHYFGRVFSTFASLILKLPVYDTQCGAKIIKTDLASKIFSEYFISSWLFDVEIFARIIRIYGYKKSQEVISEIPLTEWVDKGKSRLKFKHLLKMPFELYKIHRSYKI